MASIVTPSDTMAAVEKMAPPTVTLLPDKRNGTNSHSSPARAKKTTTNNAEKKPLLNGHASPLHVIANISSNHAGKPSVEGFLKTDDRMRLAKERREERERGLAAREQLIREKERRSQLQYERTVEERWKRLEEQRHKEEQRRAAVEEKRRLQLEEERERLEALMRRSLERSLNLENRHKRLSRFAVGAESQGFPNPQEAHPFESGLARGDTENATLSFSAASALSHGLASPLPAVSESAPCSPRRSPLYSSRSPADTHRSGLLEGSQSTPNTPKKERLQRERRTASPGGQYTKRRCESPANVTKLMTPPTISKLASKTHMPSAGNVLEYNSSPSKPRPSNDKAHKGEATGKNKPHIHNAADVCKGGSSEAVKGDAPEKKENPFEKKSEHVSQNRESKRESSPCTVTGKAAAGITNAEEASRLLAERRRQARAQKELEDKKREQADEERVKEKQQTRLLAQEQKQQKAKESEKNGTVSNMGTQQEDKQQDVLGKKLMGREREKDTIQAHEEEALRQRQDREQQSQQEVEQRQLRKKRIDEIMKRTRKGEVDVKDEQVETRSPPGEVVTVESKPQGDFVWRKEQIASNREGKREAAAQMDNPKHVEKLNNPQVTPDKSLDNREMIAADKLNKEGVDVLQVNANKQPRIHFKDMNPFTKEPTKETGGTVKQNEMNGVVKRAENVPTRSHVTAEVSKQKVVSSAKGYEGQGPQQPPAIQLEPLEVKRSCDEVQSMDISPASKEELISIPEFSPVNEVQQCGISNTRALQDLMDLTGSVTCSKRTSEGNVGDCNKNLIQGVVSPVSDSKLIGMSPPSSNQLNIH
ncbi:MAP7 domain-containing protein 2a isoform X2 [Festucalex cinctus]